MNTMTAHDVVKCVRRVLARHDGDWISIPHVHQQLVAHPEQYGISDYSALPRRRDFESICRACFRVKKERDLVVIRDYRRRQKEEGAA